MSTRRFLLAAAVALAAIPAFADLTLIAPRKGERLEGGREATLIWSSDSIPANATEWEAFLSVDGGEYYAVRITPHLDAGIRSVRWRVPNVGTTRARLMFRVGDEEDEHVIVLPQTFSIVPRANDGIESASEERQPGESALPGGEPTVEWISADFVTHRRSSGFDSRGTELSSQVPCDTVAVSWSAPRVEPRLPRGHLFTQHPSPSGTPSAFTRPLLLLTTRLNI